jgi:hypothetical protein
VANHLCVARRYHEYRNNLRPRLLGVAGHDAKNKNHFCVSATHLTRCLSFSLAMVSPHRILMGPAV